LLHKFESEEGGDVFHQQTRSPTQWAAEAMAWAATYEQVTGVSLDADIPTLPADRIRFTKFAGSCAFPGLGPIKESKTKVYFSESTKTRRELLQHLFKVSTEKQNTSRIAFFLFLTILSDIFI
jgi:hypothetical protein